MPLLMNLLRSSRTARFGLSGLFGLVLCLASPSSRAGDAPDSWVEAAREVLQDPFFQTLPVSVRMLKSPESSSPASMRLTDDSRCELLLQHRPNPKEAQVVLSQASPSLRPLLLRAVIVHELAHCWRYQDRPETLESLFQLSHLARVDERLAPEVERLRQQEETFADMVALSWVEHRHPGRLQPMLTAFFGLRTDPRLSRGAHDTLAALERVRRHGMVYGETPFHAADTMLALLRPARTWTTARRAPSR